MGSPALALDNLSRRRPPSASYPLKLAVTYSAYRYDDLVQHGAGETVEMSSTRIKLQLAEALDAVVTDIRVSIAWPATLGDGTKLQFVVQGRPSRVESTLMEITILKHEFKTAPKRPVAVISRPGSGPFAVSSNAAHAL